SFIGTVVQQVPFHWEQTNKRLRLKEARDVDDNNTIIYHLMAAHFKPTPISWLHRQFYSLTRTPNNGTYLLGESNPVMGALVWYYRRQNRGNPEMAELYRPLVMKYFSPADDYERLRIELASAFNAFSEKVTLTRF